MRFKLQKNTKIYVAGHKGLIGSSFIRYFNKNNYRNIISKTRAELELTSEYDVNKFFKENQPEIVILAAGKVGGIIDNRDFPADFMRENLAIQQNVFNASQEYGVPVEPPVLVGFGVTLVFTLSTKIISIGMPKT